VRLVARGWANRARQDEEAVVAIQQNWSPAADNNNRILVVRYEDFAKDAAGTRDSIFRFLNLDARELARSPVSKTKAWSHYFHEDAKKWFKEEAGGVLIEQGYEINNKW